MNTVLYLTASHAVWVGMLRGVVEFVHEETFAIHNSPYQLCEWMRSKKPFVQLILDCPQEEIDFHPLNSVGNPLSARSNASALRQQLIQQYPQAIIRTPEARTKLQALLVQTVSLSEQQFLWIDYIKQSEVVIGSVSTSSEVLADFTQRANEPVLVIACVGGALKHLLCRSGYGLFVRHVDIGEVNSFRCDLDETLTHLASLSLVESTVPVYTFGLTDAQLDAIARLESIAKVDSIESLVSPSPVGHDNNAPTARHHGAVFMLVCHALKHKHLRKHHARRYVNLTLCNHDNKQVGLHPRSHIVALGTCALVSLTYTLIQEQNRQSAHRQYVEQKSSVTSVIQQYQTQTASISERALSIAEALAATDKLNAAQAVNPGILLAIVASALAEHRELQLQEFSWLVLDANAQQSLAMDDGSLAQQVSSRKLWPTKDSLPSRLMVSIVGAGTPEQTLREQQVAVNALAETLKQQIQITHLTVVETPLNGASSQSHLIETHRPFSFRIDFQVAHSV